MPVVFNRAELQAAAAGSRRQAKGARKAQAQPGVQPWQVALAVAGLLAFIVYLAIATNLFK